jgi:tetratricopeptide (TPR) repeat protein
MRGAPRVPSQAEQDFSSEDLRLTQSEIVRDVHVSPEEIEEVIDAYEANLESMVDAATAAGARIVLMTVASNWKWRGRQDLPEGWAAEVLGEPPPPGAEGFRRVRSALDAALREAGPAERSELLFRRAVAAEALGDFDAARDDYRNAMNEDPHLRRALDAMNERVRAVAARRGVPLLDVVALLESEAPHGIVGFEDFYDYVHFTPRGDVLVASALRDLITRLGLADAPDFDGDAYRRDRVATLDALEEDPVAIDDWMGFGSDRSRIADRDLWKYERMVSALGERVEANPGDARAHAYLGNAAYFRIDGAAEAEREYRAALALAPDDRDVQANLDQLRAEARGDSR